MKVKKFLIQIEGDQAGRRANDDLQFCSLVEMVIGFWLFNGPSPTITVTPEEQEQGTPIPSQHQQPTTRG